MTMIRPGVYGLSCDVTEDEQVGSLFQTVGARFQGQLDLLVNCAGVMSGGDPTHITSAEFGRVLQVNVVAPFVCSREAILMMKAKGDGGRILNIGSIAAIAPRPESAPYSVSKAALGMLTQSLSLDARQFGAPFCRAFTHPGGDDLFDPVAHSPYGDCVGVGSLRTTG
jgi:NAD(P)-dependent dehydrogenase (short-subunit alcohol dehydrogenase family)